MKIVNSLITLFSLLYLTKIVLYRWVWNFLHQFANCENGKAFFLAWTGNLFTGRYSRFLTPTLTGLAMPLARRFHLCWPDGVNAPVKNLQNIGYVFNFLLASLANTTLPPSWCGITKNAFSTYCTNPFLLNGEFSSVGSRFYKTFETYLIPFQILLKLTENLQRLPKIIQDLPNALRFLQTYS